MRIGGYFYEKKEIWNIMSNYDFKTLSPYDFELLARDLLQCELHIRLQAFKTGKDKGIDLRYCRDSANQMVVQCKLYSDSGFSKLKKSMVSNEKPKVDLLRPGRYILVTSVSMLPQQKDELAKELLPHIRSTDDIFSAEDVNNLLQRHPQIERQHFKLWLPSVSVLQTILHNRVFAQTKLDVESIAKRLSIFVHTDAVDKALALVKQHGFCLLSGVPGIGKTTTAEIVVSILIERGWDCVSVTSNIDEAFHVLDPTRRQVFLYDDFLGQTSLQEKLAKNEDKGILRLITECQKSPETKCLVLTTRESLFTQACYEHERISKSQIPLGRCVIKLEDYNRPIRAKILTNHLFFFGVDETICRYLIASRTAHAIIEHANYNPRVIEEMCTVNLAKFPKPETFAQEFIQTLNDPSSIWTHAFTQQLSEPAKEIFVLFGTINGRCTIDVLEMMYHDWIQTTGRPKELDYYFRRAMGELEGSFLRVESTSNGTLVSFHTPALKDFAEKILPQYRSFLRQVLISSRIHEQAYFLATFFSAELRSYDLASIAYRAVFSNIPIFLHSGRDGVQRAESMTSVKLMRWIKLASKMVPQYIEALIEMSINHLQGLSKAVDAPWAMAALIERCMAHPKIADTPQLKLLP